MLGKKNFLKTNCNWGNRLRSIPFLMSGHLNFKFFQALGTPLFNTNLNNGCPNMIYQHSGQAHKHFSHRFHGRSFLADVQTWELKLKFVFSATNLPHCQNLKTQRIKIITSMSQITLRDSSDHFYPPTGHVRPWDFVQPPLHQMSYFGFRQSTFFLSGFSFWFFAPIFLVILLRG